MKIYDECIRQVMSLLSSQPKKTLLSDEAFDNLDWPDVGRQNIVLKNDMAFELGGDQQAAISFLGITSNSELIMKSGAYLYGNDLSEIHQNQDYARITLLQIDEDESFSGEALYDLMHRLQNTKYKVNPSGFMSRISTSQYHEPVRVSKRAIEEGLSFKHIAYRMMNAYDQLPEIKAVQVYFVTLESFEYPVLLNLAKKTDEVTRALNHVLKNFQMDCSSCQLQAICNEVEGMRDMHFNDNR